MGEDPHKIALEQQHKAFTLVHRILKRSKRRQAKYANKNTKDVEFKIGDPVYYKNNHRQSKLQSKWKPFYRIIEQISPVTFKIKSQLDGKVTKAHKELLRLAKIDEWELPTNEQGRPLRKAAYVMPPESQSDNNDDNSETNNEEQNSDNESIDNNMSEINDNMSVNSDKDSVHSDSNKSINNSSSDDSEDNIPLAKLAKKYRKERDNSSSEDDIPLFELSKRLEQAKNTENLQNDTQSETELKTDRSDDTSESSHSSFMEINECKKHLTKELKKRCPSSKTNVKQLLRTIADLL
ncbi:superoxide-generating NADPH oxidase heavy chain subunit C-like [Saccostrea cucullata]|uniref:superoxide-generating NADPH oxidase heavy chain subunit C-like n=1 Tax=Saccostrea cuccullata TaxID=36930 RepID=UPI002ED37AE3